jgi:hypothetical protein
MVEFPLWDWDLVKPFGGADFRYLPDSIAEINVESVAQKA